MSHAGSTAESTAAVAWTTESPNSPLTPFSTSVFVTAIESVARVESLVERLFGGGAVSTGTIGRCTTSPVEIVAVRVGGGAIAGAGCVAGVTPAGPRLGPTHAIDDEITPATTAIRSFMPALSPSLVPQTQSPLVAATVDGLEYSSAARVPSPPALATRHCAMM